MYGLGQPNFVLIAVLLTQPPTFRFILKVTVTQLRRNEECCLKRANNDLHCSLARPLSDSIHGTSFNDVKSLDDSSKMRFTVAAR